LIYKEKWKAMSKFHKIVNIFQITFSVVIIVFSILGLTNVMDIKITGIIALPFITIVSVINGVAIYKSSKVTAYFSFAVTGFLFIVTIIVYNNYFGI
jgi:hypothetical protein